MTSPLGKLDQLLTAGSGSGGYTRLPNVLLRRATDLGLDRPSLLVLLVLLSLRLGDRACVSVQRLAHDALLSARAVKKAVNRMETAGLLVVQREPYRYGPRRSNTYRLEPLAAALARTLQEQPWVKQANQ